MNISEKLYVDYAKEFIKEEIRGLEKASDDLNKDFNNVIKLIIKCKGKVILSGIGKSGHIAQKISSTFSSTGTQSFFIHPSEASHGDMGNITKNDVLIILSKSGGSNEIGDMLKYCHRNGVAIVAITAERTSMLGKASNFIINIPNVPEACPLNLAPTTSTLIMLSIGDALAATCLKVRDFTKSQFSNFHPGGKLGYNLCKVTDLMHQGEYLPLINYKEKLNEAIIEMSRCGFGCVGIIDDQENLIGIYTDGDLRRSHPDFNLSICISEIMNSSPITISSQSLVEDVAFLFTKNKIPSIFIVKDEKPIGIVHIHDLLQRGLL